MNPESFGATGMFGGAGTALANMFKSKAPTPGIGQINPANIDASGQMSDGDPMGTPYSKPGMKGMTPELAEKIMKLRASQVAQQGQGMAQAPMGQPAPPIQPGGLMGQMPGQMPQGMQPNGMYRPRGMAGRF